MASTTTPDSDVPAAARVADCAPSVSVEADAPAKPDPAPAVRSTAPAARPPAKKRVAAKAAPHKIVPNTITPAAANAKADITKEATIMETTIKNAAEKAKTLFNDANAKSNQAFGDINDFAKGNIEAIVESGKVAAKGIEAMGQDAADYGRQQFEGATAMLKSLSGIKSPTDFFKLQGDYMRTSFDSIVAHTSKNTEAMLKLAGEVAQPIQNRVAVAVEKVKIAA